MPGKNKEFQFIFKHPSVCITHPHYFNYSLSQSAPDIPCYREQLIRFSGKQVVSALIGSTGIPSSRRPDSRRSWRILYRFRTVRLLSPVTILASSNLTLNQASFCIVRRNSNENIPMRKTGICPFCLLYR